MAKKFPSVSIGLPSWRVQVFLPDLPDSYYRGTRFDRAGVFGSVRLFRQEFCAPWLESCDPLRHDNVQGPAEEWGQAFYDEAAPGETFLKIGVGKLVRPDDGPYDHFRLYEVADAGTRENTVSGRTLTMRHILDGVYDYTKVIALGTIGEMTLSHRLTNTGTRPIESTVYNHNFFTLGSYSVRQGREIAFPYPIHGKWREEYDSVYHGLGHDISFRRKLKSGESVFMGDIRSVFDEVSPYDLRILHKGTGLSVHVSSPTPFDWANFWANHRIACIEPFVALRIAPGETFIQTIQYNLSI